MKLRHRHSLSIFLVGAACVAAMIGDRWISTRALLADRASTRAEALAAAVARDSIEPLLRGDGKTVLRQLNMFSEIPGVERIQILDPRGRATHTAGRRFGRPEEGALFRTARELAAGPAGEPVTIEVTVSSAGQMRVIFPMLARGALWGGLSVAFLALVSWWLGRLAGGKIDLLVEAASRMDGESELDLPDLGRNSEIGSLARSFQELRRRLKVESARRKQSEEQRDDMTNMLVHDMKQPLTIFRVALDSLDRAAPSAGSAEFRLALPMAHQSAARMEAMVDGMLQIARLEHAGQPPRRARTPVREVMADCAAEGSLIARSAGRAWTLSVPKDLEDLAILAHLPMLRRLMGNLVLNAFEHSPRGSALELGARWSKENPSSVELFVSNDGSELEGDPRGLLLGEKYQGAGGGAHAGLGLAFCVTAAKLHAGRLDARRLEDGRVVFFVAVPLAA